jgi:hypothetical protein
MGTAFYVPRREHCPFCVSHARSPATVSSQRRPPTSLHAASLTSAACTHATAGLTPSEGWTCLH